MLQFENVTSTGYTIVRPDGSSEAVTTSGYNNDTGTGYIFWDGLTRYEFDMESVYCASNNIGFFVQKVPAVNWTINHKLGRAVMTSVTTVINGINVPIHPQDLDVGNVNDQNQVKITFSSPRAGEAIVRI